MNVVFISGPHGCGKTAFMEALLEKSEVYIKDSFFLDFVNDLPAISHMSIFEKCLLRLYHRFYTAQQANLKCKKKTTIIKFYLWIGVFMILLFIIQWSIIWGH